MTTRPTLTSLFARQSRRERARFVAALYAARGARTRLDGASVEVDGERFLVASRWADVTSRVGLGPPTARAVDVVVAATPARAARLAARYDARALSAVDLDRLARYGLDRATADDLLREHVGRPVDALDPPPSVEAEAPDVSGTRPSVVSFAVGCILIAVLFGVVLSGPGATTGTLPWAWDASETVSVSTPASPGAEGDEPTATAVTASTTAHTWVGSNTSGSASEPFAPGLSTTGVTNVDALADAHAAALGNGSYRWELAYVERVNGTVITRGTEVVRVASRRSFVSDVDWRGSPVGFTPVAARPSYADGTARHHPSRDDDGVVTYSLIDLAPAGEQGWRASRYVRWFLSASNSSLERTLIHTDTPTAVVEATGTTYPNTESYAATAHVTADGFVRSLSVSYVLTREDGPPVTVEFSFRYAVEEAVSVPPPTWYSADQARRAG